MTELRGITWDHSRGYLPMVATAQRFAELHPDARIQWEKRSLQQFADWPIEKLARHYDLLVIDHPFVGYASENDVLLPLDEHVPAAFLAEQAASSVGPSHASYFYGGHQWALAIDAATPVAGFRRDLLERAGAVPPTTWAELLDLASRGLVAESCAPALPAIVSADGGPPRAFPRPAWGETSVARRASRHESGESNPVRVSAPTYQYGGCYCARPCAGTPDAVAGWGPGGALRLRTGRG